MLTVYGIETYNVTGAIEETDVVLQQRLPFTVLKLVNLIERREIIFSCDSIAVYSIESCMLDRGYR